MIAADGLLVEHSVVRNTRGTDPEASLHEGGGAIMPHPTFVYMNLTIETVSDAAE